MPSESLPIIPTIQSCLKDLDELGLSDLAYKHFKVEIDDPGKFLVHCITQVMRGCGLPTGTETYKTNWLKRRLEEYGCFPCGCKSDEYPRYKIRMHTGFLSVVETPEQLARLHNESNRFTAGAPVLQQSAMARTLHFPSPINRTAARVVPNKEAGIAMIFLIDRERRRLCYDLKWRERAAADDRNGVEMAMIFKSIRRARRWARQADAYVVQLPARARLSKDGEVIMFDLQGRPETSSRPLTDFIVFSPPDSGRSSQAGHHNLATWLSLRSHETCNAPVSDAVSSESPVAVRPKRKYVRRKKVEEPIPSQLVESSPPTSPPFIQDDDDYLDDGH